MISQLDIAERRKAGQKKAGHLPKASALPSLSIKFRLAQRERISPPINDGQHSLSGCGSAYLTGVDYSGHTKKLGCIEANYIFPDRFRHIQTFKKLLLDWTADREGALSMGII